MSLSGYLLLITICVAILSLVLIVILCTVGKR